MNHYGHCYGESVLSDNSNIAVIGTYHLATGKHNKKTSFLIVCFATQMIQILERLASYLDIEPLTLIDE